MTDRPVIVNETSRRFARNLKEAFPVSENYRAAVEGPEDSTVEKVVDVICWILAVASLVWIAWAGFRMPAPW
jgi:hypothetical protein